MRVVEAGGCQSLSQSASEQPGVCVCVQVTVEDEGELRTLVDAARMEKKEERVSSYRVIVAATRQSRASLDSSSTQYRSCENLLQHLQAVAEHSALTGEGTGFESLPGRVGPT